MMQSWYFLQNQSGGELEQSDPLAKDYFGES